MIPVIDDHDLHRPQKVFLAPLRVSKKEFSPALRAPSRIDQIMIQKISVQTNVNEPWRTWELPQPFGDQPITGSLHIAPIDVDSAKMGDRVKCLRAGEEKISAAAAWVQQRSRPEAGVSQRKPELPRQPVRGREIAQFDYLPVGV